MFERGTLWRLLIERTRHALDVGALQQIATDTQVMEDGGIRFVVRVASGLECKRAATLTQHGSETNPFLPYDENMFVTDVSDTHVCLLNKFNVVDHHLLIVTREFEDQESLLTTRDFEAMWICLGEYDGLAFYNAGAIAGASQPHKHLQQVPLPLGVDSQRTPVDPILTDAKCEDSLGVVARLPFLHSLAKISQISALPYRQAAAATTELYLEMLTAVGRSRDPGPYDLLVTRDWMLLVPRSVEKFESISVNALGFAGSLLVCNWEELNIVRRHGPMQILRHVGMAKA